MIAYIIRRMVAGVLLIVVMSIVTFALFFASPIDPAQFACGKNCSVEQKEETRLRWATTTLHRAVGQVRQGFLRSAATTPTTPS